MTDDIKFKPLTQEEVDATIQKIVKANPAALDKIFQTYTKTLNQLLVVALKQTTDESEIVEIERLKRIINLCPIEERFIRSKDKIWAVRDHIIKKNADFFLKKDYSSIIKKDGNQIILETLIEIIKDKFTSLSTDEKEFYWKKGAVMLSCVIEFKQVTGDYTDVSRT